MKGLVTQLYGTVQERERRIQQLEQHLHLLVKRFLHPGSEKIDPRQAGLVPGDGSLLMSSDAAAPESPRTHRHPGPPRKSKRTRNRPNTRRTVVAGPPDTIEHRQVTHDLTVEQKCGKALEAANRTSCILART